MSKPRRMFPPLILVNANQQTRIAHAVKRAFKRRPAVETFIAAALKPQLAFVPVDRTDRVAIRHPVSLEIGSEATVVEARGWRRLISRKPQKAHWNRVRTQ